MKKQNKGITLVALVITIIILLILAGISISSLTGSGLFQKASDATKTSDRANVKEQLQIAVMTSRMDANGIIDKEELRKELENLKKNGTIDSYEAGAEGSEIIYTATKGKDVYEINKDGEVKLKGEAIGKTIIVSGLTVKNGDTVLTESSEKVAIGQPLKVSFKAEIAGGTITSVKVKGAEITNNNGSVEYATDGSIVVTFEIEGKSEDGTIVRREYKVNLKGYYDIPQMKVGDYVNYTPDPLTIDTETGKNAKLEELNTAINTYSGSTGQSLSQTSGLKWRILELDETGTKPKTLISANTTNEGLTLKGANGYNNAVYLLNEACKTLYSKAGVGEARSITIKDLEDHYSQAGKGARDTYTGAVQYGQTKKYEGSYAKYPKIAKEEKDIGIDTTVVNQNGLDLSEQGKNEDGSYKTYDGSGQASTNGITITQTHYHLNSNLSSMYDLTNPYYNLFHESISNSYWLASRCVNADSSYGYCGIFVRFASSSDVSAHGVFYSHGYSFSHADRLRPVVSLESNIEAEYEGKTTDNAYNIWNI